MSAATLTLQDDDLVEVDDSGFELMGSDLMGGASLATLKPEEKQQLIRGIVMSCRFVGTITVPTSRGDDMVEEAARRVRSMQRAVHADKEKVLLHISTSGIKVNVARSGQLRDSHALSKVTFVTVLTSNPKVFAFITAADAPGGQHIYTCSVFKSKKKSRKIVNLMGLCFSLSVEMNRLTSKYGMSTASMQHGGRARSGSIQSAVARRGVQQSQEFLMHIEHIRRRCAVLNGEDRSSVDASLNELVHLWQNR